MKQLLVGAMFAVMSLVAGAQEPAAPAPASRPAQAAPAPAPPAQAATAPAQPAPPARGMAPLPNPPRNLKFDITITDTGGAKPVTKTLSVTVAEGAGNGSIRNVARIPGSDPNIPIFTQQGDNKGPQTMPLVGNVAVPLNIDVRAPVVFENNVIRANVLVEYQPYVMDAKAQPGIITASATSVFQNGQKTVILQAADPISDRRTTIEVTATILK